MTAGDDPAIVRTARGLALGLVLVDLAAAAVVVVGIGPRTTAFGAALAPVAGLLGLVAPVIGYRAYLYVAETSARPLERRFVAATVIALSVTAGIALLGVVAYALSSRIVALTGIVGHVILAGAVWPSPWRLEAFDRDAA